MSSEAPSSVRKRIVDMLIGRLQARSPDYLDTAKVSKNRATPIGGDELPAYSVYFVNNQPTPGPGDPRRASLNSHKLLIEVRIITKGNDDAADPHCQWVISQIVSADRCIDADGNQLALGITEGETPFEPLEGAQSEITVTRIRFVVEYTTNRLDMTVTK